MGHPGEPSARRGIPGVRPLSASRSEGLSRSQRVTQKRIFQEAYAQDRKYVGRYMVLWVRQGDEASLRLGVVASRKVGNAVRRAAAKRRLRECYRRQRKHLEGDYDIILVARGSIITAPWESIVEDMRTLLSRADLLRENETIS